MNVADKTNECGQTLRHDGGQAVIIAVLFFLTGSLLIIGGVAAPVLILFAHLEPSFPR